MDSSFDDGLAFYRRERRRMAQRMRSGVRADQERVRTENAVSPGTTDGREKLDDWSDIAAIDRQKAWLRQFGIANPYFRVAERFGPGTAVIDGRECVHFSGYDYVGLGRDDRMHAAVRDAVEKWGTSASASRIVGGDLTVHRELERALADFVGTEDAIAFISGYGTNVSTVGHLFGPDDLILCDEFAHNSLVTGGCLSAARLRRFPHDDWEALDDVLSRTRSRYDKVLVLIEGAYSMDGDVPDLPRFVEVKERHGAVLMVDEAHSLGVLGATGRGVTEHFDLPRGAVDLTMGTLSKTFGSSGGFIAASHRVVEYLKYTTSGFVFSVGLSPQDSAAALTAVRILDAEPERVARLRSVSDLFRERCVAEGLDIGLSRHSAVVPVIQGNSERTLRLSSALFDEGINVLPILPPGVTEAQTRLRFFLTADHTEDQVLRTVEVMARYPHAERDKK